jgi:hypothetical protein
MEKRKKKFVLINLIIVILYLCLETILKVSMKENIMSGNSKLVHGTYPINLGVEIKKMNTSCKKYMFDKIIIK